MNRHLAVPTPDSAPRSAPRGGRDDGYTSGAEWVVSLVRRPPWSAFRECVLGSAAQTLYGDALTRADPAPGGQPCGIGVGGGAGLPAAVRCVPVQAALPHVTSSIQRTSVEVPKRPMMLTTDEAFVASPAETRGATTSPFGSTTNRHWGQMAAWRSDAAAVWKGGCPAWCRQSVPTMND